MGEPGQLELFAEGAVEPLPPPAPTLPELHAIPEPALHHVRRLSFTALSLFETCSYRYFAERVAGMRSLDVAPVGHEGLSGTAIGSAVHAELEHVDLAAPALATGWEERVRGAYPRATDDEVERIRSLIEAYCASELAARVAGLDGVAKERHFAFEHDGVLLHGFLDTYHRAGERALVVDYKTNLLDGREPAEIVAREYRAPAARLRARVLPRGRRRSRGRVPVPRASGRAGVHDVHARRVAELEARALGGDRPHPRRASSGRRRASTRAPAARRSTSSAPGRGCRTAGRERRRRGVRVVRSFVAEARRRGSGATRADRRDHRAPRARAPGRDDRAHVPQRRSSCSSR